MRQTIVIAAAIVLTGLRLHGATQTYEEQFSEECAKVGIGWTSDPRLVETNNTGPVFRDKTFPFSRLQTAGEFAGIKLGMTMSEVVAVWGKPRSVYTRCGIGPRFSYGQSAFLFFREKQLVSINLFDRFFRGLTFDNGFRAEMRLPDVVALLGSPTPGPDGEDPALSQVRFG